VAHILHPQKRELRGQQNMCHRLFCFLYNGTMKKLLHKLTTKDSYFRAGAGVVVLNNKNEVVIFERVDLPGEFQFSQGGVNAGENPETGAYRELFEETGIAEHQITKLGEYPGWLSYEANVEPQHIQDYRGQVQRWYYARIHEDTPIDLGLARDDEFMSYKWLSIKEALDEIVIFKREMYVRILDYLQEDILDI